VQKTSPLKYSSKVKNNFLSVTVSGHFSLSEAKIMYTAALEYLLENNLSKLFFDAFRVKGVVTTMDRYYFGEFAAFESLKYIGKGLKKITVSICGEEPIIDPRRFGEIVARNRGLNLKVTTDKNESLQFLGVK
jgi:hypothetical protein